MLPTERVVYSVITERAPLKLPGGARMAVWIIVNVEEWDAREAMPRTVLTPPAARHPELGLARIRQSRRLLALRRSFRCAIGPGGAGDQWLGAHGISGDRAHGGRARLGVHRSRLHTAQRAEGENERADIRKNREVIADATGKPPRGWLIAAVCQHSHNRPWRALKSSQAATTITRIDKEVLKIARWSTCRATLV
jgi:allantoinase